MKIRIGNFEFEGTFDELRSIQAVLDIYITKANKIIVTEISQIPPTTVTPTPTPTVTGFETV